MNNIKFFDQRTDSDCLRCCLASLLCLEYEDVPDFVKEYNDWYQALCDWARDQGYMTLQFHAIMDGEILQHHNSDALWIATGPAQRGHNHAVLFRGSKLIHDPHSSKAGLESITSAIIFIPNKSLNNA